MPLYLKGLTIVRPGIFLALLAAASLGIAKTPAAAMTFTTAQADVYKSVEMEPPTASQMTVCYGFACRLRLVLVFTPAERKLLIDTLAKGKASASDERKAI